MVITKRIPATAGHPTEPDEERREAFVVSFFETGNAKKSAALTGVHINTAQKWKTQAWFEKAVQALKRQNDKQLDGRITAILAKTLGQLEERIEEGDEKLFLTKDGEVLRERVKVSSRDLAVVTGVLFDKRAAIRKEPDNDDTASSALDRIAEKLREYARTESPNALRDTKVVDVEATEISNDDLV